MDNASIMVMTIPRNLNPEIDRRRRFEYIESEERNPDRVRGG